jgi:uncharacterized protein (TIGR02145 family)
VLAVGLIGLHIAACTQSHNDSLRDRDGNTYKAILMPDNKLWMADNLNLNLPGSYCYDDQEQNCKLYGRLYTWQLANEACSKLGEGWRLPGSEGWQRMADAYGDTQSAYKALIVGGSAKFNVVFGGRRDPNGGPYARKDAHGFYWTSSEIDSKNAWFYNLGTGGQMVTRHEGDKDHSISARCIRD